MSELGKGVSGKEKESTVGGGAVYVHETGDVRAVFSSTWLSVADTSTLTPSSGPSFHRRG